MTGDLDLDLDLLILILVLVVNLIFKITRVRRWAPRPQETMRKRRSDTITEGESVYVDTQGDLGHSLFNTFSMLSSAMR